MIGMVCGRETILTLEKNDIRWAYVSEEVILWTLKEDATMDLNEAENVSRCERLKLKQHAVKRVGISVA